jgi:hypothetical protein
MNKLFAAVGLCFVVPVMAMDLTHESECKSRKELIQVNDHVSDDESKNFAMHLKMAVGFGERVVGENKLPNTNPMHVMLSKLSNSLLEHDGDIRKLISSDQELVDKIKIHQQADNHPFVQFGLEQIRKGVGNVDEAKKFIVRHRLLEVGFNLNKAYPAYSNAYMGEVQKEERINFMIRNADYPVTEAAIKDFISMFIYQVLFATKVD